MTRNPYREYVNLCRDRGVFPKSQAELYRNDYDGWMACLMSVIAALPSEAERQVAIEQETASKRSDT